MSSVPCPRRRHKNAWDLLIVVYIFYPVKFQVRNYFRLLALCLYMQVCSVFRSWEWHTIKHNIYNDMYSLSSPSTKPFTITCQTTPKAATHCVIQCSPHFQVSLYNSIHVLYLLPAQLSVKLAQGFTGLGTISWTSDVWTDSPPTPWK